MADSNPARMPPMPANKSMNLITLVFLLLFFLVIYAPHQE
jgi:hypothetical protein